MSRTEFLLWCGIIIGSTFGSLFGVLFYDTMDPSPSDILYSKIKEYRYRKSLYSTAKKHSTIKQIVAIIAEILIIGGIFIIAQNTDFLDVISVICIVAGVTCFQLYDFIINNAKTCSINFRYQIEHHKVCKFKYVKGWDRGMIVRDVLFAALPFTTAFTVLSAVSSFYSVDNSIAAIMLVLYVVCDAKSLYYICRANSGIRATVCFIVQMISFFVFFCITWYFPTLTENSQSFFSTYPKICCFLLIFSGISYLGLLMYLECFWHREIPYIIYPGTYNEEGNYFKIKMTDGEVFNSKEKFFYPVTHEGGVLLLFVDGTSIILNDDEIKDINSYGAK